MEQKHGIPTLPCNQTNWGQYIKIIQKNDKNRMTWHQKSSDILLSHQQEIAKCQTSNNLEKRYKKGRLNWHNGDITGPGFGWINHLSTRFIVTTRLPKRVIFELFVLICTSVLDRWRICCWPRPLRKSASGMRSCWRHTALLMRYRSRCKVN